MELAFHHPTLPLADYVALLTYYKDYQPDYAIERLLPDGGIDLVIDLTTVAKHIYDNELLTEIQTCNKAWISGMRTGYISIQAGAAASEMFVIRFCPGMAWSFVHLPVLEMKDQVIDAGLVFGNEIYLLREQLMEEKEISGKFRVAEKYLLQRIKNHFEIHPAVKYCINRVHRDPSGPTVQDILHKTGYSHKHLISLFGKYAGLNPKQYLRVMKFQQAVHLMEKPPEMINWTGLAIDCGYYDQAHFINEFRKFSGYNPKAYMEARGEFINYIPIRER